MREAIVDGVLMLPTIGVVGKCPFCREDVFPKAVTSEVMYAHWSHYPNSSCPLAVKSGVTEPVTPWHNSWTSVAPKECREVKVRKQGEYRIADIRARTKTVIEVQHSEMVSDEMKARESFYGRNQCWVMDCTNTRIVSDRRMRDQAEGIPYYEMQLSEIRGWMLAGRRPVFLDCGSDIIRLDRSRGDLSRGRVVGLRIGGDVVRNGIKDACDANPVLRSFFFGPDDGKVTRPVMAKGGVSQSQECHRQNTSRKVFDFGRIISKRFIFDEDGNAEGYEPQHCPGMRSDGSDWY